MLYWADFRESIWYATIGSPPAQHAVGTPGTSELDAIATDEAYVYWTDLGYRTIARMPLGGGPVEQLTQTTGSLVRLAVDSSHLYWSEIADDGATGLVKRMPKTGGAVTPVATQEAVPVALAVQASYLYLATCGSGENTGWVSRVPVNGSTAPEVLADSLDCPMGIVLDQQYVYWAEFGGRIVRLAR
ncbi:MAG: hypothetical protein QM767_28890 [Anaeromyxobacter sp.]